MSDYNPNYVFVKNFYLLGVKLVLENNKGELLLLKRSDKVSRAHGWDFPGGAVDAGEAPDTAIVRELFEETGLSIDTPSLYASYLNTSHEDDAVILAFFAQSDDLVPSLSWEHEAYEWMSLEKLSTIELPQIYRSMVDDYFRKKTHN
jgi:8-oxo-dGTP diphosphatase